jgi:hypothetical protein
MPEEIHHPDGRLEHPSIQFETKDVHFRTIIVILVGAIVLAFITFVVLYLFFRAYSDYKARIMKSPFPLAPTPSTAFPESPVLEGLRSEELVRPAEISVEKGYVRIPVEEAMKYLANKLPARPASRADAVRRAGGLVDAGEPNSGRLFRRGR